MKRDVAAKVIEILKDQMPILELRGSDSYSRIGGDLDFIVPSGHPVRACFLMIEALEKIDLSLVYFRNMGYVASIVVLSKSKNDDQSLKIDFIDGLRWYGVGQDKFGNIMFETLYTYGDDKVRLAGAVGYFQKLFGLGKLSRRDWDRIKHMGVNSTYIIGVASKLSIPITNSQVEDCSVGLVSKWRLRAHSGGVTTLNSAIIWFLKIIVMHIRQKMKIFQQSGLVIGISGIDGSGKSTIVQRLLTIYQMAGVPRPEIVHLLPSWIPMPHQIIRRQKTKTNYTRPYSEPPVSSKISSGLRLCYYMFTFATVKVWLFIRTTRGEVTILDRSVIDFGSDPTRSRISFRSLPKWLIKLLLPKGMFIFLNTSPEIAVARKGELTLSKANALQVEYLNMSKYVDLEIVDGDQKPDMVFKKVIESISHKYKDRLIKNYDIATRNGQSK